MTTIADDARARLLALVALRDHITLMRQRTWLAPLSAEEMNHRERILADHLDQILAALLPPVGQPEKDLRPIIADMQMLSDQADAANGTSEYQTALVSLGLVARHYLRELAAEAPVGQEAPKR